MSKSDLATNSCIDEGTKQISEEREATGQIQMELTEEQIQQALKEIKLEPEEEARKQFRAKVWEQAEGLKETRLYHNSYDNG
jgi:hypothetical protein